MADHLSKTETATEQFHCHRVATSDIARLPDDAVSFDYNAILFFPLAKKREAKLPMLALAHVSHLSPEMLIL